MRFRRFLAALTPLSTSLLGGSAQAQSAAELASQRYAVDPMHSSVAFATTLLKGINVRGRFTDYDGTIIYDAKHPERSSVSAVIKASSITTDMKFRDDHLRSPDFFDVEHFPTIEFTSNRVVPRRGFATVTGTLTMHGISRQVSFPARIALAPYAVGTTVGVAFTGALRVSRKDFGIAGTNKFNPDYNPLTNMLSDSADILLEVSAIREGHVGWKLGGGNPPGVADTINRVLTASGMDAAVATYRTLRETRPTAFGFSPFQLDLLGHQVAERGELANALTLFKLNAEQFSDSAGVLESLGEAQALANDASGALTSFRRARERFPQSTIAREMVRHLEKMKIRPTL